MTKRQLCRRLAIVAIAILLYGLIEVGCNVKCMRELQEYVILIAAAYLAHIFVRRNQHAEALRRFWARLVPSVQAAVQYTHHPNPEREDFARTMVGLSIAIDDLRAFFKNVRGLYPYEPLKEIHDAIAELGFGDDFDTDRAKNARRRILNKWREVRDALQRELGVGSPSNPVSRFLRDERAVLHGHRVVA